MDQINEPSTAIHSGASSADERRSEMEDALRQQITHLWSAHTVSKQAARSTGEQLKMIRLDLGRHLHEMKFLLVRTGRDGGWSEFLRAQKIPRTSADRYVERHEELIHPENMNRPSGAVLPPSEEQVCAFFRQSMPKLSRFLTTGQAVYWFVREMVDMLPHAAGYETERGVLVLGQTESEAPHVP